MSTSSPSPTCYQTPMVGMPSGFPLLFDGLIGRVRYDSTSNTHASSHFPRNVDEGQEGKLMSERLLSVDAITAHLGFNPDMIFKWITRKSMPAHKTGSLWKLFTTEVDQSVKTGITWKESARFSVANDPKLRAPSLLNHQFLHQPQVPRNFSNDSRAKVIERRKHYSIY